MINSPKHEDFVRLNMADSVCLVLCAHPDVCVCEVINLGALYYKEVRNLIAQLSSLSMKNKKVFLLKLWVHNQFLG